MDSVHLAMMGRSSGISGIEMHEGKAGKAVLARAVGP